MSKATWNRPKYPQSLKNRLFFWLSLGIFRSFSKVSRVLCLFWGSNGILVVLKVSVGIVVVLGSFWSFSRVLGYFGYLLGILVILAILRGSFHTIWRIYWFFNILEVLLGKIIFLTKKTLEISKMAFILSKLPKYPKNNKMSEEKIPPKSLYYPK